MATLGAHVPHALAATLDVLLAQQARPTCSRGAQAFYLNCQGKYL